MHDLPSLATNVYCNTMRSQHNDHQQAMIQDIHNQVNQRQYVAVQVQGTTASPIPSIPPKDQPQAGSAYHLGTVHAYPRKRLEQSRRKPIA